MKKLAILLGLSFVLLSACQSEQPDDELVEVDVDLFQFEEKEFDFGVLKQSGGSVSHDFNFTYTGDEPITIVSTPASCACTEGEISQDEFQPGESGVLTVYFNPNLHSEPEGLFFKSVLIMTDPSITPPPEVKIWQEIDLDLGEEFYELKEPHDDNEEPHEGQH